jgi:hypothetical protein
MSSPFKKPKMPEPTEREQGLRMRQERALDRERDEELRRRRLILSGRLGMRQLLSGSAAGIMEGQGGARAGGAGGRGAPRSGTVAGTDRGGSPAAAPTFQVPRNIFGPSGPAR